MTDAEQIEAWRSEFHEIMLRERPFNSIELIPRTITYAEEQTFNLWFGFLMAKRSQPVIEMPSVFDFRENPSYSLAILQNHLEDIGIKFRVKE